MSERQPGWLLRQCEQQIFGALKTPRDLRPYQTDTLIPFILKTPKCGAFVDMGLGKTVSVLTALDTLLLTEQINKVLIIAPKRVAIQTWPTELREWRHCAWMSYSLIRSDPTAEEVTSVMRWARKDDPLSPGNAASKARTAEMDVQKCVKAMAPQPIHIINREQLEWLVKFHCGTPNPKRWNLDRWPYDMIVVDESTSFADHTSSRYNHLRIVAQKTKRIVLLSGTPAPEGIADLFPQIYLLDGGVRFGKGITNFRARYMMQNQYTKRWEPQRGAVEEVAKLCSDICLVMKAEDYHPRDKAVVIERPIMLEKAELLKYREFRDTFLLALPDDDAVVEAVNSGVLHGKLLQFASVTVYGNDKQVHLIHDYKIEELKELVAENPDTPLMVAYWFKPSLRRLQAAFPKATTMDADAKCVAPWNAGKIPMLFIHPQSGGHGLNMQLGPGHTIVFFDTPESLEYYEQVCGRIDRSGQKKVVKVIHLTTRGTIEQYAVSKLMKKESLQSALTRRMQAERDSLLREREL